MEEYKPKSSLNENVETIDDSKRIEPIVKNPVKVKKKSFWHKVYDEFITEDGESVGDYILIDVLVPAIKKTISDIVTNGIDMILFGGTTNRNSNRNYYTRPSYSNYYDQNQRNSNGYPRQKTFGGYEFREIIFDNRGEADSVLNELNDIIRRYGFAKVADFYDLVGVSCSYTDNNYGWSDLRYANIIRQREGYSISLPKPIPID